MQVVNDCFYFSVKSNKKKVKRKHDKVYESSESEEDHVSVETPENSDEQNEETENTEQSNAGWADSITKILKTKKPKKKKTLVLSKAKKLTDVSKVQSKPAGFQVETVEGEIKEEKIEIATETDLKSTKKKVYLIHFI